MDPKTAPQSQAMARDSPPEAEPMSLSPAQGQSAASVTSTLAIIQAAAVHAASGAAQAVGGEGAVGEAAGAFQQNNFLHDLAFQQHMLQIKQSQIIQQQILEQQYQRNRDMLQAEHERQMAVFINQVSIN